MVKKKSSGVLKLSSVGVTAGKIRQSDKKVMHRYHASTKKEITIALKKDPEQAINIVSAQLKTANKRLIEQNIRLQESKANVQALIDNTLQALMLLDKSYGIITFNEVAVKTIKNVFGIHIKKGDNLQSIFLKKKFKIFEDDVSPSLTGKITKTEHDLINPKGKKYTFNFNFTPVLNQNKEVESVSFSMLDITELKNSKSELAQSEKLIESVFHTADIGLAIIDAKGNFVKVNEGFCRMLKYSSNDLKGKPYLKIIPSASRKETKIAEELLLTGKNDHFEFRVIDKEGDILDVNVTSKLFTSLEGESFVIKTMRDISDERKYKDLFLTAEKIMHIGSFEYNQITQKLTCTDEIRNIFEVGPEFEYTIDNFGRFMHPVDGYIAAKTSKELLQHHGPIEREFRVLTATKKEKWVLVRSMPLMIKSKVIGFRGSLLDITSRKETEKEIERLSWVARHTNNGVIITDHEGKIEWMNQSFERMTGYAHVDIKGKKPGDLLFKDDSDKHIVKKINEFIKKKLPIKEILLIYTAHRAPIWVSMDIAPIFERKVITNFIYIITDITELIYAKEIQKTQEALEQRQRLMDAMAGNFPDGIIGIINRDLKYIYVGGRELKKFGHQKNDLLGDHIFDKISEDANEYAKPFLKKVFDGENAYFEVNVIDDFYSVYAVPINKEEKPILRTLVVIQNITQRKKAEQEMVLALEQQKELTELKSRFVTLASHEFRTPLSTILSSADLVARFGEVNDKENYHKHLNRIKSSVKSLNEILNEFLSLSSIEEGVVKNKPTEFNVREFCEELVEEAETVTKKNQVIYYQHKGDINTIFADRWHLKNVLSNLLSNAIKYSQQDKVIRFTSEARKGAIKFVVQDEGIGIPNEDKVHLFETFFRARNAAHVQGTGIGLHIVKRYLDIMGGTIAFESELNKGTTFRMELPQPEPSQ